MPYFNFSMNQKSIIIAIVALIFASSFCVWQLRKKNVSKIPVILFSIYIFALIMVTFIANPSSNGITAPLYERINLTPIINIINAITFNIQYAYIQLVLNIILFIPLGLFLPIIFRHLRSCPKTVLIAGAVTLVIELCQWLLPFSNRIFDLDDIVCNVIGALVGYSIWYLVTSIKYKAKNSHKFPWGAIIVCILFLLFLARPTIHSGQNDLALIDSSAFIPVEIITGEEMLSPMDQHAFIYSIENVDAVEAKVEYFGLIRSDSLDDEYAKQIEQVNIISLDEALKRSTQGMATDIYTSGISHPSKVVIHNVDIAYQMNRRKTRLIPVWHLSGEILPEGSSEAENDLLQAEIVVPAI